MVKGTPFRWREVTRGFGLGVEGEGEIWWREIRAEGPDERSNGWVGWNSREEISDGWVEPTSLRRWTVMVDGESLRLLLGWLWGSERERRRPDVF